MELSDQELEQLEDYYTGSLVPAARLALEQRMQQEGDFEQAARAFLRGVEALEMGEIKTHRLYLDATQPVLRVSFLRRWWWVVVATIVGIVFGSIWWGMQNREIKPAEQILADEYFKPYLSSMGQSSTTDTRPQGIIEYENENYAGAIPYLEREGEADQDPYTKFLLANAYFATGRTDLALPILLAVEGKAGVPAEVDWYIALAYLKTGARNKGVERLEQIKNSEGTKKNTAQVLLEKLNVK